MAKRDKKATVKDDEDDDDATPDTADDAEQSAAPRPVPSAVSVPAKASCLTFIVLLLTELVVLLLYLWNPLGLSLSFNWLSILIVTFLVFAIPIVVYRAVSLWMFDESSRYPDIAEAWQSGLAELRQHGLTLSSAPLFLIVGTGNDKLRKNFMSAAQGDFSVDGVCDPGSPLYWYANADGIFLFLNDVSWMNAAITLYEIQAVALKSGHSLPSDVPQNAPGGRKITRALGTLVPEPRSPLPPRPERGLEPPSDLGASPNLGPGPEAAPRGGPQPPARPLADGQYFGTLNPGQVAPPTAGQSAEAPVVGARPPALGSRRAVNRLTSQESSQQLQRLETVCGLLRRNRHPVCPANGILALLPFEMLKAGDQDVAELERAISADLATIYRELNLRCPATAVVVGMEQERGFRELIRRIGREGAAKQRFGQRFDLRAAATVEELRKFTSHVCGTFEDFVYTLFRDEQALSHPGNTYLYALLCKVRRTLKARLGDVLGKGFGWDRQSTNLPALFSGCYFAATGPKADRQAFVSGLLSKLYDEQEDIEWTEHALREDRRRGWFTKIGWAICGILLLLVVVLSYWRLS